MDCCSKYSQYRHHPGLEGGLITDNATGYYSHHMHPSFRYHQSSLYRFNGSNSGYNGIGPPSTSIPIPSTPSNLYQNYDRYTPYSNLSPYTYNSSNNFSNYGNMNVRGINDYYNHCDNFNRIGIGSTQFSYHNYRDLYGLNLHNSRTNGYNMYSQSLTERDYSNHYNYNSGYISHSNNLHHHHHHNNHYHHRHHLHYGNSGIRNTPKDSLISRNYDNQKCNSIDERNDSKNDGINSSVMHSNMSSSSSSSISPSQTDASNNTYITHNRPGVDNGNYNSFSNDETSNSSHQHRTQKQQQQQQQQQTNNQQQCHIEEISSSSGMGNDSTEFSCDLKETKSKKSTTNKEKDKTANRQLSNNRKIDCTTPLNQSSPVLERASTPFVSNTYLNSNNNSSKIQNELSFGWSNFELNGSNWNQNSPKLSTTKKRSCRSPKSSPTLSVSSFSCNKNRVLECDLIPSKKSKRKIKSESLDDSNECREEIKNITPLPGFQEAFGSTEIGRFSETFFHAIDSPIEQLYGSETDTLSPQPWETGDSLDGPHYNLHIDASVQSISDYYTSSIDSTIDSTIDNNYFNEIQCSGY